MTNNITMDPNQILLNMFEQNRKIMEQNEKILQQNQQIDNRLTKVEDHVAKIEDRVVKIEDRVAKIEDRVAKIEDRVAKIEDRVAKIEDRAAKIEDRVTKIEDRVAKIEDRVAKIEDRVAKTEDRVAKIEDHVAKIEDRVDVKDKVKDYIGHTTSTESTHPTPRHVSKQDKVTKLYRQTNQASAFSLDGDDEDDEITSSSKQSDAPVVDIKSWFLRSDMLYKYECEHIDENNQTHPSLLLVSATHLYILRKLPEHKTMANLVSRRLLQTITKITSKQDVPEILTFHYRAKEGEEQQQVKSKNKPKTKTTIDCDKVYILDAGDATKNIKILIMKALHMFDESTEPSSS